MTERHHFRFPLSCIGEGNGNPLQFSCLENPRDGGAWWAVVSGVAQSWTWLKRLSSSSSKLIELEEVVKTWGLNPFCQKHKWQLNLQLISGGQSYRTESLICGIWCYPWVDSVRTELNCRTPSRCWRTALPHLCTLK